MTREYAKREIDSLDFYLQNHTDDYSEESHTAMMMAIKALEQEPCEDAISRTELLARIDEERKYLHDLKMDGAEHIVVHHARRIVEDMPSVIPHPKIGHWIDKFGGVYRCSCCREIISIDTEIEFPNGITYKYCPNCGCRMADTQESEEV